MEVTGLLTLIAAGGGAAGLLTGGLILSIRRRKRVCQLMETGERLRAVLLRYLNRADFGMRNEIRVACGLETVFHRGGYRRWWSHRIVISAVYRGNTGLETIKANILPEIMKFLGGEEGFLVRFDLEKEKGDVGS